MNRASFIYRLLLVGLLPVIGSVIYFEGQNYDPALIAFNKKASGSATASDISKEPQPEAVVKNIAGFKKFGEERHYTKENLYEHVDGHAEYFISAGFQGLTVTEYNAEGSRATQAEIQAETYDMGKSIQAFGVLMDESGEGASQVSVGTMGYKTSAGVNFIKGRYYIKISSFSSKTPLIGFAKAFAETLPAGHESFEIFSKFPNIGKIEKTSFAKEGYRGLDFLHNVVEREYSTSSGNIKVALMAADDNRTQTLLASFSDYFAKSNMRNEKIEIGRLEAYRVFDKYEGNWFLVMNRDGLFGIFGTEDEKILKYFAKDKK